jgi:hypothetical protein
MGELHRYVAVSYSVEQAVETVPDRRSRARPVCGYHTPVPGDGPDRRPPRPARLAPVTLLLLVAAIACSGHRTTRVDGDPSTTAPRSTSAPSGAPGPPACSAAALDATPPPQAGLPPDVAQTRQGIVAAATACDFERLGDIASAGGSKFTHSFGNGGDPAAHWRGLEQTGDEPLRYLVELLSRPYRSVAGADPAVFTWPSAHAYDSWDAVPPTEQEALRPLYGESELESFDAAGAYLGYRVGIRQDGEWMYFVAGD